MVYHLKHPVPATPLLAMTPCTPYSPQSACYTRCFNIQCCVFTANRLARVVNSFALSIALRLLAALIASCRTRHTFSYRRQERLPRSPFAVFHSRREPRHPRGKHKEPYHSTNFGGKLVGVHIIGYQMFRCCVGCVCSLTCCRIRTPTISPRSNPSWPSNLQ